MKFRVQNVAIRFGVRSEVGTSLSALTLAALLTVPAESKGQGYVEATGGDSTYMIVEDGTAYWVHKFTNTVTAGTTLEVTQGGGVLIYSGGTLANCIITNNPVFVDKDAGNYRLNFASPCLNTGMNQSWMLSACDLDGKKRLDTIYHIVDMGTYEYVERSTLITVR